MQTILRVLFCMSIMSNSKNGVFIRQSAYSNALAEKSLEKRGKFAVALAGVVVEVICLFAR